MDEKLQPRDCRFCRSKNVLVVQVDEQLDGDYFAVECQCCWAEGPHSVTKEMAIRMWGLAPVTANIQYSGFGVEDIKFGSD